MNVRPVAPSIPTGTTCDSLSATNVISFLLLTAQAIFSFLDEPAGWTRPRAIAASDVKPVHSCKARLQTQLRVDYAGILSGRSIVRHAYVPVGTCVAQQMPDAAR